MSPVRDAMVASAAGDVTAAAAPEARLAARAKAAGCSVHAALCAAQLAALRAEFPGAGRRRLYQLSLVDLRRRLTPAIDAAVQSLLRGKLYLSKDIIDAGGEGLVHEGNVLSVELPFFVELEVTDTDPGLKGDTAQGGTKPATLETGASIQVPLFVEIGDVVKVDRREDKYLTRVTG